ncbi:hypothetical protein COY23_00990 [bacterium (Candidatus Torokbacteria) CG_4_10_14_0_2_um_filter_35_8]|nr:MAG: hypothetical protein COY23_00990 [bacterium (Candidatus Torokbacteria) CG_4_10_14_0_2_um_filter_35_8]
MLKISLAGLIILSQLCSYNSYFSGGVTKVNGFFNTWETKYIEKVEELTSNMVIYPALKRKTSETPITEGKAAVIYDPKTRQILWSKRENEPLPLASLSKVMTAIIVLENCKLTDKVKVPKITVTSEDAKIGLKKGEVLTVQALLDAMLIRSANDAAIALAIHCGGSIEGFVELMNQKAEELGLENTGFANSAGLDEDGNKPKAWKDIVMKDNHVTALDMAKITAYALDNEEFVKINRMRETKIKRVREGKVAYYEVKNTHHILRPRFKEEEYKTPKGVKIIGGKTGYTEDAGFCLMTITWMEDRPIIFVILNSSKATNETKSLIDWVHGSFEWR